jgi:hypothetical protein
MLQLLLPPLLLSYLATYLHQLPLMPPLQLPPCVLLLLLCVATHQDMVVVVLPGAADYSRALVLCLVQHPFAVLGSDVLGSTWRTKTTHTSSPSARWQGLVTAAV